MDPLSDVLSRLKPRTYVTGGLSAGGQWSLQLPAYGGDQVLRGSFGRVLAVGRRHPTARPTARGNLSAAAAWPALCAGQRPHSPARGCTHTNLGRGKVQRRPFGEPGGGMSFLLESHFALEGDARFLLDMLPPIVLLEDESHRESIRWAVERMLREMRDFQPGRHTGGAAGRLYAAGRGSSGTPGRWRATKAPAGFSLWPIRE